MEVDRASETHLEKMLVQILTMMLDRGMKLLVVVMGRCDVAALCADVEEVKDRMVKMGMTLELEPFKDAELPEDGWSLRARVRSWKPTRC